MNSLSKISLRHSFVDKRQLFDKSVKHDVDITLVTVATLEQGFYVPFIAERWKGPIVVTLAVDSFSNHLINDLTTSYSYYPNVRVVRYKQENSLKLPINSLRNLAISQVQTSYFLYIDVDVMPSNNLYSTILDYLSSQNMDSENSKTMIIIPFVYFKSPVSSQSCFKLNTCQKQLLSSLPTTKVELIQCIYTKECVDPRTDERHTYLPTTFFQNTQDTVIPTNMHEQQHQPFVVLPKSRYLPLYNEAFENYGANRLEYIIHLKCLGYKQILLNQAFLIHLPHQVSIYKVNNAFADSHIMKKLLDNAVFTYRKEIKMSDRYMCNFNFTSI